MRVVGDCDTTDTVRIEGQVEGSVRAEKGWVVGKGGSVVGDIHTQDAVIAGSVKGALTWNRGSSFSRPVWSKGRFVRPGCSWRRGESYTALSALAGSSRWPEWTPPRVPRARQVWGPSSRVGGVFRGAKAREPVRRYTSMPPVS